METVVIATISLKTVFTPRSWPAFIARCFSCLLFHGAAPETMGTVTQNYGNCSYSDYFSLLNVIARMHVSGT